MKPIPMRSAFSMITAIFVIMIMASIGAFVMNLSGKVVKSTTLQYQHEQAILYAKSYTEFAVMAITAHNRNTNCLEDINGTIGHPTQGQGYHIEVRIAYIGTGTEIGNCSGARKLDTGVTTNNTPLTAIIDVYVRYQDPDDTGNGANAPWLTVHRRTVQKI